MCNGKENLCLTLTTVERTFGNGIKLQSQTQLRISTWISVMLNRKSLLSSGFSLNYHFPIFLFKYRITIFIKI